MVVQRVWRQSEARAIDGDFARQAVFSAGRLALLGQAPPLWHYLLAKRGHNGRYHDLQGRDIKTYGSSAYLDRH
jgi:hypothetical protein